MMHCTLMIDTMERGLTVGGTVKGPTCILMGMSTLVIGSLTFELAGAFISNVRMARNTKDSGRTAYDMAWVPLRPALGSGPLANSSMMFETAQVLLFTNQVTFTLKST